MNQLFQDTSQQLFIKTLAAPAKVSREMAGSAVFSLFAITPNIKQIDTCTVLSSLIAGVPFSHLDDKDISQLIITFLSQVYYSPIRPDHMGWTLVSEIDRLMNYFGSGKISKVLDQIKSLVLTQNLVPVHGDLQKQNLFLVQDKLALIDFEHFCFAPLELELVNSLFFDDANCLPVAEIIPVLLKNQTISKKLLVAMLIFYTLRQLADEKSLPEVQILLPKAVKKLAKIVSLTSSDIKLATDLFGHISSQPVDIQSCSELL